MKRNLLVDSAILAALTILLIFPLFRLEYSSHWESIESTFIADARMLAGHLPHPGWQPLWYCGTRFDYVYPPALRYGTALISLAAGISTARAYHLYTGAMYVFGIVAVYWLVRVGSGSRKAALYSAAATALISPSFLLLPMFRHGAAFWIPQRLHVLTQFGEGPHISSLSILPAALAASFLALRSVQLRFVVLAGALSAFVVANNFYGATALAMFFPVLVWSVWTGERSARVWIRALGIAVLAWGFSAFWLTPSFIHITLVNMRWVSQPGNLGSVIGLAVLLGAFGWVSFRWGTPEREWLLFVCGTALLFSFSVLGFYAFGVRVMGEPVRLVPELDLVMILLWAEVGRRLWARPKWRVVVAIFGVVVFFPAIRYVRHAWTAFPQSGPLAGQYEYQIAGWVNDHLPGQRVIPSGSVRFWYDAWSDNEQPDGGSMQGMLNQILPVATYQVMAGADPELTKLWLQALGTDALIVPDRSSPEPYHDYQIPQKFRGAMEVLHDDGHGTVIYRVPRVHPGIGRVVTAGALEKVGPLRGGADGERLGKVVAIVENPSQPAVQVGWHGFDHLEVQTQTAPGTSILLQETWDPAWHAYENQTEVPVKQEPVMGFMLLDVPPGHHDIRMQFVTPLENIVGFFAFGLAALVSGWLWFRKTA